MSRQTIAGLQKIITSANDEIQNLSKQLDHSTGVIRDQKNSMIKKDAKIQLLQKHINFVHAQRDRLVGFIEGRESITDPEIELPDISYRESKPSKINRVEKFVRECTLQFVNDDGPTVREDALRCLY